MDPNVTQKQNLWSFNSHQRESQHTGKKGEVGDPILIIRNEQGTPRDILLHPDDHKGWIPTIEDINIMKIIFTI